MAGLALPLSAQRYTISGYVRDAAAEETMIGATVYDHVSGSGTVTNAYGFYSLTLPEGKVELTASYVGYAPQTLPLQLTADTVVNIAMRAHSELEEVTIVGNRLDLGVRGSQMSAVDIPVAQIKAVPAMFGETDVLKVLQLLPGVQSGTEGTAGLYVRGGSPDENLMLLDGVPVYNVNHMFGFFSAFNADAIKNVTLYKGSFPAHYAGRLSSVVDVRMKEGDMYNYHGNLHVGAVSSKLSLEGPLWKGKTSFNISARRTYSDLVTNAAIWYMTHIEGDDTDYGAGYYFYDLNVKVNHKFSDRDRLYLSYYSGDDEIYFSINEADNKDYSRDSKLGWKWGNIVTAARWNHVITPKMFLDASVNYTQYRHKIGMGFDELDKIQGKPYKAQLDMKSGIFDLTGKAELHYSPTPQHDMRMGMAYTYHTFRPEVVSMSEKTGHDTNRQQLGQPDVLAHETQLYAEDNMTLADAVKLNAGLNYSTYTVGGKFYHSLEPRLSSRLLLTDHLSLKAGYAYMTQYVHMLSNSSISLPTDLWVPSTERIVPEHDLHEAMQNRPGERANAFAFLTREGKRLSLYDLEAEHTLILFSNPECAMCRMLKDLILHSAPIVERITEGRLKMLVLYPDEDLKAWERGDKAPAGWIDARDEHGTIRSEGLYDLRAIPSIYLLDRDKRVLVKDSTDPREVEQALL